MILKQRTPQQVANSWGPLELYSTAEKADFLPEKTSIWLDFDYKSVWYLMDWSGRFEIWIVNYLNMWAKKFLLKHSWILRWYVIIISFIGGRCQPNKHLWQALTLWSFGSKIFWITHFQNNIFQSLIALPSFSWLSMLLLKKNILFAVVPCQQAVWNYNIFQTCRYPVLNWVQKFSIKSDIMDILRTFCTIFFYRFFMNFTVLNLIQCSFTNYTICLTF